jgi:hypothetical protein
VCNREGHDRFPFAQRQGIGCRHLASAALEAVVGAITPQPSNGNTRSETNKPDRKKTSRRRQKKTNREFQKAKRKTEVSVSAAREEVRAVLRE